MGRQQVAVRDQDLTFLTKLRLGLAPKGCVPFVSAPMNIRITFVYAAIGQIFSPVANI
jgi:hypothetical protein